MFDVIYSAEEYEDDLCDDFWSVFQRNRFPSECECYVKIMELMTLKNSSEQTEEEEQGA